MPAKKRSPRFPGKALESETITMSRAEVAAARAKVAAAEKARDDRDRALWASFCHDFTPEDRARIVELCRDPLWVAEMEVRRAEPRPELAALDEHRRGHRHAERPPSLVELRRQTSRRVYDLAFEALKQTGNPEWITRHLKAELPRPCRIVTGPLELEGIPFYPLKVLRALAGGRSVDLERVVRDALLVRSGDRAVTARRVVLELLNALGAGLSEDTLRRDLKRVAPPAPINRVRHRPTQFQIQRLE